MGLKFPGVLALLLVPFIAIGYALIGLYKGGEWLVKWIVERRRQQQHAVERELDRKQAELRGTILNLADALGWKRTRLARRSSVSRSGHAARFRGTDPMYNLPGRQTCASAVRGGSFTSQLLVRSTGRLPKARLCLITQGAERPPSRCAGA